MIVTSSRIVSCYASATLIMFFIPGMVDLPDSLCSIYIGSKVPTVLPSTRKSWHSLVTMRKSRQVRETLERWSPSLTDVIAQRQALSPFKLD